MNTLCHPVLAALLFGMIACSDSDTPASDSSESGSLAPPRWTGVASVSDSDLDFDARIMVHASPDSAGSSSGSVNVTIEFRYVDPLPEGGPRGATMAFQFGLDEASTLLGDTQWVRQDEPGETGIIYPRAQDGQWVARVVSSMQLQRLPNNQFDATIELSDEREVFQATQGAEAAPSATVYVSAPVAVASCSVYHFDPGPFLVDDTLFESEFCQNFLAQTGLGETSDP